MIVVKVDSKEMKRFLRLSRKKLKFAQSSALNMTAEQIIKNERRAMQRVFDAPTRWILNGMYIRKAGPNRLEASVGFKDRFAASKAGSTTEDIIWPHIKGIPRPQKRGERALSARGRMKGRRFYVPGRGARLNAAGNMTRGQMNKLISGVQGQRDRQQDSKRGGQFFVGSPGGKPLGIYQRMKRGVKPMLIFVNSVSYRKRFDYFKIADQAIKFHWPRFADRAVREELRGVGRAR